jgi:hypothetical protein
MADYVPVLTNNLAPQSHTTSAAVVGGTFAVVSGTGTVATAGAASAVIVGVFAHDAASGARVSVWPIDGVVHEMVTTTSVTQGGGIQSSATGLVDPATTSIAAASAAGTLVGVATTTATAPAKVRFMGRH